MNIYLMKQHKSQKIFLLYAVHQLQSSHSVEWRIDVRYLYYYQQLIDSQHKWCIKLLRWKKQRALNNYLEFKHDNIYIYMIHIYNYILSSKRNLLSACCPQPMPRKTLERRRKNSLWMRTINQNLLWNQICLYNRSINAMC